MLPKSPSMSSVEDDSDEELPCVTLSQSTWSKSELEMPTASEVASLRAREDAAERALRDLRDSCNVPLLNSLSRSASQGSSGEEGEAALSARVSALQVSEQPGDRGIKDQLQILIAIRDNLPEESPILNEYIQVLTEKPERAEAVTKLILRGVRSSLISRRLPSDIGVCVCLLRAALRGRRGAGAGAGAGAEAGAGAGAGGGTSGAGARAALHALLNARHDVSALANAVSAAIEEPEQLLAVHDAVRDGTRRGADRLAAALLARAVSGLLPQDTPNTEPPAPLSSESVSLVRSSWRKLSTRAQLTLLRCAGRLLAAVGDVADKGDTDKGDVDTGEAEIEGLAALLEAVSQPLPRASAFDVDRQQVLTNVSTLQQLFRSRFVPESEHDTFIETHFNCSQISVDSIDTPIKLETPIKAETPIKEDTSIQENTPTYEETQIKQETLIQEETQNQQYNYSSLPKKEIKVKIPMELVTPMRLDNPIKMPETRCQLHQSINQSLLKCPSVIDPPINDSPMKDPNMNDLPINDAIDAIAKVVNDSEIKAAIGPPMNDSEIKCPPITPVKGKKTTQMKLDGYFKQTPVKVDKVVGECSPERKRIRRELPGRRCAHRNGRS